MDNINNQSSNLNMGPTIAILPPLPESEEVVNRQQTQPITQQQQTQQQQQPINPDISSPRLSSQWTSDSQSSYCNACTSKFDAFLNRKHHCRLCGLVFCNNCSNTRSLIPPSALVLRGFASHSNDGDSSITYVNQSNSNDDTLLYGKGLEQRMLKARHPQRTCHSCAQQLAPIQNELCLRNSNAMRYNYIDEGDAVRRLSECMFYYVILSRVFVKLTQNMILMLDFYSNNSAAVNSPLAFTLGHEVRKAAYALTNLLPGSKGKRGGFVPTSDRLQYSYPPYRVKELWSCGVTTPFHNNDNLLIKK